MSVQMGGITPEEVRAASMVLNAVLVPLLGLVWRESRQMKRQLDATHDMVKSQNGRVGKLEQWTRDHEILDRERSVNIVDRLDRVQTTIEAIRINHNI